MRAVLSDCLNGSARRVLEWFAKIKRKVNALFHKETHFKPQLLTFEDNIGDLSTASANTYFNSVKLIYLHIDC